MQYRKLFVPRFLDYLDDPNVVVVIQDESIYRSNEYNNFFWQIDRPGEKINNVLRSKGMGYGTMVSGFITIDGFLSFTDEEMALINAERAKKKSTSASNIFGSAHSKCRRRWDIWKCRRSDIHLYLVQLRKAERRILGFRENGSTNQ